MGLNWVPEAEELPCHIGARTARLVRTQRREDFDDLLVNAFYFFGGRGGRFSSRFLPNKARCPLDPTHGQPRANMWKRMQKLKECIEAYQIV